MRSCWLNVLAGAIVASLLAYVCGLLVGYTAAIAVPHWYFELAKEISAQWIFMFLWEVFIVQLFGALLPCFLFCYFTLKIFSLNRLIFTVTFVPTYIFFTYVFNIYALEFLNYYELSSWFFMHPVAIALGLCAALLLAKRFNR